MRRFITPAWIILLLLALGVAVTPSARGAVPAVVAPVPPQPQGLTVTFEKQDAKFTLLIKWTKPATDKITVSYRLYSDEIKEGELMLLASIDPIKATEYRLQVYPAKDRTMKIGLVGLSGTNQNSPRAEASVFVPSMRMVTPANVKGSLGAGADLNKAVLTWEYADTPSLAGFQIIENGKKIADATTVGAAKRQWVSPDALPKGGGKLYSVEAISKYGVVSLSSGQVSVAGPTGASTGTQTPASAPKDINLMMRGKWAKQNNKDGILLTWDPLPNTVKVLHYYLTDDGAVMGTQGKPAEITPTGPNEYFFPVPGSPRSYDFRLLIDTPDQKSVQIALVRVLKTGVKLPPAALLPLRTQPKGVKTVMLNWYYLNYADLDGFRIYQNGTQVVSESKLRSSAMRWTSPELAPGEYSFELEAVARDGSVSERGPALKVVIAP